LRTRAAPARHQCPALEERLMRMTSSLVAPAAVVILSTTSLCGLSAAVAQTPSGGSTLPSITVQAPKPRAVRPEKPQPREIVRETVRTAVYPGRSPSPTTATGSGPLPGESPLARLRRLERTSSSTLGGVATSFPKGNLPYVGCSASGWPAYSPAGTCRNGRNFKTYAECTELSHFLAWRPMEYHWYCTSLAFKK